MIPAAGETTRSLMMWERAKSDARGVDGMHATASRTMSKSSAAAADSGRCHSADAGTEIIKIVYLRCRVIDTGRRSIVAQFNCRMTPARLRPTTHFSQHDLRPRLWPTSRHEQSHHVSSTRRRFLDETATCLWATAKDCKET
jgi:hypothetical protein